MSSKINISNSWKEISNIFIKISGQWKTVQSGFIKILGEWKQFFSGDQTPEIEETVLITGTLQSNYTYLLTGTNYHWTNYDTLTGYFEWSQDGGSTWNIISTINSLINPVSGSSNSTSTYVVLNLPNQISPNIDNLYRFRVYAVNGSQSFSSTSNSFTISTPRNVTNVSASQVATTLQATISFTPGLYTQSVRIVRKQYNGATLESTTNYDRTTSSPATIPLQTYGRSYTFQIIPYSGPLISSTVSGYSGNTTNETQAFTANFPPQPIQLTKPTLSNTGSVSIGTILTANRGSYNLNTIAEGNPDIAIQTRVYGWQYPGPSLTSGTTTNPQPNVSSGSSQSLTTTQNMVNYVFYAVDIVISSDAQTTYYYYSDLSANAFLPSFSDNFNRPATTGSEGIGVTSTGSWIWSNDMEGTYGWMMPVVDLNNFSWQIDYDEITQRRTAYTAKNPSLSDNVSNYPLKSINVGDSNVSLKVSVADGGGGPGLAFWVTGSGSWWAVAPYYNKTVVTTDTYTCTDGPIEHTSKDCPTITATVPYDNDDVGKICSCTAGSTTTGTACNDGPYSHNSTACPPNGDGSLGTVCSCTAGSTTSNCNGSATHYDTNFEAQLGCGSCTITFNSNYYQTCPTPTTSSPRYSNNTLGTGCGDKCSCLGPFTDPGTSTCGTATFGDSDDPGPVVTCVTAADAGKVCSKQQIVGGWSYRLCVQETASSTYYNCTTRECSDSWSCTYQSVTTNASYYLVGATSTTTNASYYKIKKESATVTTYYSKIRILSANGSSVTSQAQETVATSNSSYSQIYGLSVQTANNTITAKAYSDLNVTNQLGNTLEFSPLNPNPPKAIAGDSSVGIVNTPTEDNRFVGNRLDNFVYTNV
jgi:hypothetical protein